jgi:hypothetical protein
MKHYVKIALILLYAVILSRCQKPTTRIISVAEPQNVQSETDNKIPYDKILIDASRDGGVWWFPQSSEIGFSSNGDHQGKQLADYLRSLGYEVDELPRGTVITDDMLNQYDKVIRAVGFGNYTSSEIEAYDHFINRASSLILVQDHLLNWPNDNLSKHLGVQFEGGFDGDITEFTSNPITAGVTPMYYCFGSVVTNAAENSTMTILGSLPNNTSFEDAPSQPVMGILNSYPNCKIFFMGDLNTLESMYQPFVDNLVQWAFK